MLGWWWWSVDVDSGGRMAGRGCDGGWHRHRIETTNREGPEARERSRAGVRAGVCSVADGANEARHEMGRRPKVLLVVAGDVKPEQKNSAMAVKESKQRSVGILFVVGNGEAVSGRGQEAPDGGEWRWATAVMVCGEVFGRWPEQRSEAEESEKQGKKSRTCAGLCGRERELTYISRNCYPVFLPSPDVSEVFYPHNSLPFFQNH